MGLEIQDTTLYWILFADDQLLIAQDYEDLRIHDKEINSWVWIAEFKTKW